MVKKIFYLLPLIMLFFSCDGEKGTEIVIPDDVPKETFEIAKESIDEIIQSFSGPVEMAALMSDEGIAFSKNYLANTDIIGDYDTNFKKALGLGVLSADLGYLNVYNQTGLIINHIQVIKRLADDLSIGQFFDFQTLKRLTQSKDNLDSLLFLSTYSYQQMDEHLRDNNRSNLSALMVTGVWIEGLFLATQITKKNINLKKFRDRIGGQKDVLNNLLEILRAFRAKDKNFADLVKNMETLKKDFENVKISIKPGGSKTEIIDGIPVVMQLEITIIEITDEQLLKIIQTTEEIRNKLIAL